MADFQKNTGVYSILAQYRVLFYTKGKKYNLKSNVIILTE